MRKGLWMLAAAAVIVILLYVYRADVNEGYTTINLNTAKAQRQMLQWEGERRYNDVARMQNSQTMLSAEDVRSAVAQVSPHANSRAASLLDMRGTSNHGAADDGSNKVGSGVEQTGVVQQKIDFCEAANFDCALLKDPRYAECGFCHRSGTNSKGKPFRGGMFISSDDQMRANALAKGGKALYKPTIGTCAPDVFTLVSEACSRRERQLECQKGGAATAKNNCGQCYGKSSNDTAGLVYVGPKPKKFTALLHVSHPGMNSNDGAGLVVSHANGTKDTLNPSGKLLLDPKVLPITIAEGDAITITVYGVPKMWCAWLSNSDETRTIGIDIGVTSVSPETFTIAGDTRSQVVDNAMSLIPSWKTWKRNVPNSVLWYQRSGAAIGGILKSTYGTIDTNIPTLSFMREASTKGVDVVVSPATFRQPDPAPNQRKQLYIEFDNKKSIRAYDGERVKSAQIASVTNIYMTIPATLEDPYFPEDNDVCPTGPIIHTEAGAGLMGSNSCFSAEGAFTPTIYCMKQLFKAAGGTTKGTLYPDTETKAKALVVKDAAGQPSLDATVEKLNTLGNIAIYGVDNNGAPQTFSTIKTTSMSMLGLTRANPCDGPLSQTGPHSPECLNYLWRTSGSANPPGGNPESLPYAYCSANGTAAPSSQNTIADANNKGSISNVRNYFQSIYNRANDTSDYNAQVNAMRQCYNISIKPPKEDSGSCPPKNPTEWQCFGPAQIAKPEVFQSNPNGYSTAKKDAGAVCAAFGARVATTAELANAQRQGADWCSTGWVSDDAEAKYPITTTTGQGCGNGSAGVKTWTPGTRVAAVNCYGRKPPQGTPNILPFSSTSWRAPGTLPRYVDDSHYYLVKDGVNTVHCAVLPETSNQCISYPSEKACNTYLKTDGKKHIAQDLSGRNDEIVGWGLNYFRGKS